MIESDIYSKIRVRYAYLQLPKYCQHILFSNESICPSSSYKEKNK